MFEPIRKILPLMLAATALLAGCSQMPSTGPSARNIVESTASAPSDRAVQLVDVNEQVVSQLLAQQRRASFAEVFGKQDSLTPVVGSGDLLEVALWEAPPATLFLGSSLDANLSNATGSITLPPQMVDRDGQISVPFVGRVAAAGRTTAQISQDITQRLRGKANQPQVMVRVSQNASAMVSVVGEVATNLRLPLTASGERLLDALAAAGGVRQPVGKVSLQITRGTELHTMPLEQVIRDPRQNIALRPGDLITALFQPSSFTALGATGRQQEVPFEAQGISLAQALGRVGGLQDIRSDPEGLFIFRFEPKAALAWPQQPVATTGDGLVPVIYRLNLRDPRSFFVMQSFPMNHKDVLYVSNSPAADLQKFLNLVFTINRQVIYTIDNLP